MHYFDYAATTPLSETGKNAMLQQLDQGWHNPSAQYQEGLARKKEIESFRTTVAKALACDTTELFFTSGGTEGNNWAIQKGVTVRRHQGKHCITSTVEHSSVTNTMKDLEQQGYSVTYVKSDKKGQITVENILPAVQADTVLLSLMMVNNETGFITPVEEIAKEVKKINPKVIIHCDAVQGFLKIPFQMSKTAEDSNNRLLNIDLLTISGHKIYAPKGTGGLFVRKGLKLPPLFHGGGQEQGLRSGTEPTHQLAAFSTAVQEGFTEFQDRLVKVSETKHQVMTQLTQLPQVKLHLYDEVSTSPNILSFSLVGYPSQVILRYLSEKDIALSAGSACHRGGESHVFNTLPLSKQERTSALRLSFSHLTTEEDIKALVQALTLATQELCTSLS